MPALYFLIPSLGPAQKVSHLLLRHTAADARTIDGAGKTMVDGSGHPIRPPFPRGRIFQFNGRVDVRSVRLVKDVELCCIELVK